MTFLPTALHVLIVAGFFVVVFLKVEGLFIGPLLFAAPALFIDLDVISIDFRNRCSER